MRPVIAALLCFSSAFAQSDLYQFAIEEDRLAGAPDFSFLNQPLGPEDRLFVKDAHFYRVGKDLTADTVDDERARLFGTNLCFNGNFPVEADAPRIARRLRRLGVNLVRLHHMDSSPDQDPQAARSILTTAPYPTVNPISAARLRALLDALKAEGIYVDLNLHVGYQFRPLLDQVPSLADFPNQSKPLHIFFPRMLDLQEEYTRKVIEALGLKGDPVLAMVEVNNESSLAREWQTNNLEANVRGEYRGELDRQWNAFLRAKYATTEKLRAAWGEGAQDGPEMLTAPWRLEKGAPSDGFFEPVAGEEPAVIRVVVTSQGPRLIFKNVGFSIAERTPYVAEVEMRAELPAGASRSIYWDIKQDVSPWRTMVNRTVQVTGQWQKFRMAFVATFAMDGIGRFGLAIEKLDVPLYVRNGSVRQSGRKGLEANESLEDGSVSQVAQDEIAFEERLNDYVLFLEERDRHYLDEMRAAIRESTDELVPVAGTQMGYGGLLNLDSHARLDYQDNHFYVDHYSFPNVRWDARDWRIRDESSTGGGLPALLRMAATRQAGIPFTVSEFNQPWPNRQAAEIVPLVAVFGAFQDWDSIMHFAYAHSRNWDDGVPNGFNLTGDWTKFPIVGQAAWLFRSGAVAPARQTVDLPVSKVMRLQATKEKRNGNIDAFLNAEWGYDPATALLHRVRLVKDGADPVPQAATRRLAPPFRADTGEFTYDRDNRLFLLHSPKAAGVFGFAGQSKVTAGAIDVELGSSARGFVTILATSLDERPLEESGRVLVSVPGYTLRTQPGSNPPRPQEMVNYGTANDWWTLEKEPGYPQKASGNYNGGVPPVWMERVESYLTLRTAGSRLTAYPLEGSGARRAPLGSQYVKRAERGFRIHLQAEGQMPSPWYELIIE